VTTQPQEQLGEHRGLAFYTIGQRKGLGLSTPQPRYVLRLDTAANSLIVGTAAELGQSELVAGQVNYLDGDAPAAGRRVTAKIRYKAKEVPAILTPSPPSVPATDHQAHLVFDEPLRDITPGQSVVFYDDDRVLGGGIIQRMEHSS